MIRIKNNGKFIIPEGESFIGYEGDNLHAVKEFFVEGVTDVSLYYRMYLEFDDHTVNFFLLDSEVESGGTRLTWTVTNDQIYKGGLIKLQIKASNGSGTVFHSAVTSLLAQTSIEFGESFSEKHNSEFLRHEEFLNSLITLEKQGYDRALELLGEIETAEGRQITTSAILDSAVTRPKLSADIRNTLNAVDGKLDLCDNSSADTTELAQLSMLSGQKKLYLIRLGATLFPVFGIERGSSDGYAAVVRIGNRQYLHLLDRNIWYTFPYGVSDSSDIAVTDGLSDGAITNEKLANGSVSFAKLSSTLTSKSSDSSQAWAFANDTTIPTTLLAKNWINSAVEDKTVMNSVTDSPKSINQLNQITLNQSEFLTIPLAADTVYTGFTASYVLIYAVDSSHQLLFTRDGRVFSREKSGGIWLSFTEAPFPTDRIQNGSIGLSKLDSNLTALSADSSQAWAFANDTTLPTTLLTKGWINSAVEDKAVMNSVTDSPKSINQLNQITLADGEFLRIVLTSDSVYTGFTASYVLIFAIDRYTQLLITKKAELYFRKRASESSSWGAFEKSAAAADLISEINDLKSRVAALEGNP